MSNLNFLTYQSKMFTLARHFRRLPGKNFNRFIRFAGINIDGLEILCVSENKRKKSHDKWDYWSFLDKFKLFSAMSLGIALVNCEIYVNNVKYDEKRFFRAAQYGSHVEIKRFVNDFHVYLIS